MAFYRFILADDYHESPPWFSEGPGLRVILGSFVCVRPGHGCVSYSSFRAGETLREYLIVACGSMCEGTVQAEVHMIHVYRAFGIVTMGIFHGFNGLCSVILTL